MIDNEATLQRLAVAYLIVLTSSTIFVDKSTNRLSDWILPYLRDPVSAGHYAWGAAVLACLYRELVMAPRAEADGISAACCCYRCGCGTILGVSAAMQSWISRGKSMRESLPERRRRSRVGGLSTTLGWTEGKPGCLDALGTD